MAEKKEGGMAAKMKKFKGDVMSKNDDKAHIARRKLTGKTTRRRARYWCFRFQTEALDGANADDAPEGFREFIESLPGFSDWKTFAIKWDIIGENPFMIVYRILSVWQEWEHVMDRVAIPVDATEEEVYRRTKVLAKEYAKKYGGNI